MTVLNVSSIQRFSTGDGPGIRTTVFLKGCNLRCPWCHNPESISKKTETLIYPGTHRAVTYGKTMSLEELFDDVIEDIDFYRESGGGVTVSGGEPLLQPVGVAELARRLRSVGISTLVDTAGCVPWENFLCVADHVDTFYYDVKTADGALYENVVRGDKALVFGNLGRLVEAGKDVVVRIPLIPGFNMSGTDHERIYVELKKTGARRVDLLPFHRLGSSKYEAMGLTYGYKDTPPPEEAKIEKIKKIYEDGFIVRIEK